MAETWAHKKDTGRAIEATTSADNVELLKDVVHLAIDAQLSNNKHITEHDCTELKNLLARLNKYGITADSLYQEFLHQGVSQKEIESPAYCGDKQRFLTAWIFPPHSPMHQLYTHKGADYDYSIEADKDYWSANEIQQSWLVKKRLLIKIVQNIYSASHGDAERIAMTLYSIHRLRDLQYNGSDTTPPERKSFLFNIPDDLKKYTLPLIKDKPLYNQINEQITNVEKGIAALRASQDWEGILKAVDALLGPLESDAGGLLNKVIPAFVSTSNRKA
jgi:hypothetical protein